MRQLLRIAAVLLLTCDLFPQKAPTTPTCNVVSLSIALKAGESYQRRIDELTFKIKPLQEDWGWWFSLENVAGRDFLYFVNPPLRFNSSQTLGRGYGNSAGQSLKLNRELRFLLNQTDYDAMEPIVTNALWSYNAPRPESAADEYFAALAKVRTGLLRLKIVNLDVGRDDAVRSAEFYVEFIAPNDFLFNTSLKPRPTACPAKPTP